MTLLVMIQVWLVTAVYPNCSDPSTYTSYNKSTEYKGLNDVTPWDRVRNTSDNCNFTSLLKPHMNETCGDCDFSVTENKWFRFDEGPYVKIAEFPDGTSCPERGHCNGFYQIALVPNVKQTGNPNSKYFSLLYSNQTNPTNCLLSGSSFLVESFNCEEFILYKFPNGSNKAGESKCEDADLGPTPYSICMHDTIIELTLEANRKYYTTDVPLNCISTRSPKPPNLTWTDQDNQDITPQARRNRDLSSLFTVVHSLNSLSYSSVRCKVEDKSQTFYRVSIETGDVTSLEQEELDATCNITFGGSSVENRANLYLINILKDKEVYYTAENISNRMKINDIGAGTYRISVDLSTILIPIPNDLKNVTHNWKCGVRDPITEIFTTVPFTVTVIKLCPSGTGLESSAASQCTTCPKNTSPKHNVCTWCPRGRVSGPGSSQCYGIEVPNIEAAENGNASAVCRITVEQLSSVNETNPGFYFIEVLNDEVVYYTKNNISETKGDISINKASPETYEMNLTLSNTSVPSTARSRTEHWKCGIIDLETLQYTTIPFKITLKRHCPAGTGFVTTIATHCEPCPRNTFYFRDECRKCLEGQVSDPGARECDYPGYSGRLSDIFIGFGVVIVGALAIATVVFLANYKHHYRPHIPQS